MNITFNTNVWEPVVSGEEHQYVKIKKFKWVILPMSRCSVSLLLNTIVMAKILTPIEFTSINRPMEW